jgi:hypothetical protein
MNELVNKYNTKNKHEQLIEKCNKLKMNMKTFSVLIKIKFQIMINVVKKSFWST